jgi:predicted Ser/Thr protein kinase
MNDSPQTNHTPSDFDAIRPALAKALAGQYAIERELGRGGMGIVVLARDERLDRNVALKVLPPALAEQADTRERFLREARMAAQLSHPNIVPIHRADDIGGFAFFAMGFVDGETLGDFIRGRDKLPAMDVVRIMREVAWALAYAHARGIVHRDVKPENILLERSTGRAIVTDFGIARADFNPALTQDGLVLGTVHYMSPEQASGDTLDGRSDLYALGCVGYYALSGRLPFEGQSPQAILVAHATREPPPLHSVAPHVPSQLAAVIDQCLRKPPGERFATGEALADALAKALDAVEHQERAEGTGAVLSNDEAMLVWRRAAELQAEAAARLEARMRVATETHQRVPGVKRVSDGGATSAPGVAIAGAGAGAPGSSTGNTAPQPLPTDAYRLRDVEAAAAEVGISQQYVALALAELSKSPQSLQREQAPATFFERFSTKLFRSSQRTLDVSRIYHNSPRIILQALGRTLQAAPFSLTLGDTLGGHPLDGGVLVFDIPNANMGEGNYKWMWTRNGLYAKVVRVTLASVPSDSRKTEVTMQVDMRNGLVANLAGMAAGSGFVGGMGALVGLVVAKKALLLAGAAVLGPVGVGAALGGMGALTFAAPLYRWQVRKSTAELNAALAAIETSMRTIDIFGESSSSMPRLAP